MSDPLFDEQRFVQSLAGDMELAAELVNAFLEDSPERSESLAAALEQGDMDQASKLAHSLKGMCGVVRSTVNAGLALSMEEAAKDGDLGTTRRLYADFVESLDTARLAMREFLARNPQG
ncbi:Hpt domain-containing protein [Pseudodesulfovibrio sp. F-1]|uniref:Hpt domain-containing protein n=1 Tax=Pseudodesulfovibrio alkaliphilus TaxID=2661613 RepID=A0A7K1KMF8_9BACT|nr:Hpt domain-containing protein [Pseudodesulfovibrio alkaliphilus]MUM77273.1 Hpt domain-containing protein [Pseudodesulfovibrio alkaliphilus]